MNISHKLHVALWGVLLLAFAFSVKWWYREAQVEELRFVLVPVSNIVSLLTGEPWFWENGNGAMFPGMFVLIDRSCSGINFMVITLASFAFIILQRRDAGCSAWLLAVLCSFAAYLLCVVVNSMRIMTLIYAERSIGHLHPATHEAIGAAVFLIALLGATLLLDRSLKSHTLEHAPVL